MFFNAEKCSPHPRRLDRLRQIVKCVDLKGLHCILIVGGDKYRDRHVGWPDLIENLKSALARHLNIKEKHVDPHLPKRSNDFPSVAAFACNFDLIIACQEKSKTLTSERLVVSDQDLEL